MPFKSFKTAIFLAICLLIPAPAPAAASPDWVMLFAPLLDVPYRQDGARTPDGAYTLFAKQDERFDTPGLNCSGVTVAASRLALGLPLPLEGLVNDRLHDSGPDSISQNGIPGGEDWDFGWDLILNISDSLPRRWLLPGHATLEVSNSTGAGPRGFDLHSPATWEELPGRLRPDALYLITFNRDQNKAPYILKHYHVGVICREASGTAWLYHTTTGRGNSYRVNLSDPEERQKFLKAFQSSRGVSTYILPLEVELP